MTLVTSRSKRKIPVCGTKCVKQWQIVPYCGLVSSAVTVCAMLQIGELSSDSLCHVADQLVDQWLVPCCRSAGWAVPRAMLQISLLGGDSLCHVADWLDQWWLMPCCRLDQQWLIPCCWLASLVVTCAMLQIGQSAVTHVILQIDEFSNYSLYHAADWQVQRWFMPCCRFAGSAMTPCVFLQIGRFSSDFLCHVADWRVQQWLLVPCCRLASSAVTSCAMLQIGQFSSDTLYHVADWPVQQWLLVPCCRLVSSAATTFWPSTWTWPPSMMAAVIARMPAWSAPTYETMGSAMPWVETQMAGSQWSVCLTSTTEEQSCTSVEPSTWKASTSF